MNKDKMYPNVANSIPVKKPKSLFQIQKLNINKMMMIESN